MRSVLLASLVSLSAIGVRGHPHASQGRNGLSRRAVDLNAFRIKHAAVYANVTQVQADPAIDTSPLTRRASAQEVADDLIKLTVPGATFRLAGDSYIGDNGIAHFYYKQTANGLDIDTADFNVNVDREGKVFSYGNSFYQGEIPAPPSLSKRDAAEPVNALKQAIEILSLPVTAQSATAEPQQDTNVFTIKETAGCVSDPEARLVYVINQEGKLSLTWRIETDILSNWLLTYVDAETGNKVHAAIDYSADATYNVYPWGLTNPTEGQRSLVKDPEYKPASEFGWHSDGKTTWNSTRGNNAAAQGNWNNEPSNLLALPRPSVNNGIYDFPYSPATSDWKSYVNASTTQLFYTSNKYHDLLHTLGFNEKAGNFELNNNNAGGKGNDFVYLNTQDGSDTDNANFATPPDGQSPRMRMYMFTSTTPWRDSSFDAGVVLHEFTHGLSTRLTGGPANSACLNLLESGGMGEGWSDAFATAIRLRPSDTRKTNYPIGEWVTGNPKGIRQALYSTDMTVNPQVYSDANKYNIVHPIGNIWATMLYEVMWNLIDKYGKNDSDRPAFDSRGVPTDGKYLALKLFMDGMALQPCNPTFVSARDAILDADKALTAGQNQCEIWKGFAKRGLGQGAVYSSSSRTNSFVVPTGVCKA